jgi:type I restriction enzyme R subunit
MPGVDKVLFVVDRKDLDYQTMREYDRFEKGAANSNTSTAVLKKQLEDPDARIIITTIQKLATFINANRRPRDLRRPHRAHLRRVPPLAVRRHAHRDHQGVQALPPLRVHRHADLRRQLRQRRQPEPEDHRAGRVGDKLHTYTIVDAITDKNVLPFRIDYVNTVKVGHVVDKQVSAIDTEKALLAVERIRQVVAYTLEHFDQKTKREKSYQRRLAAAVTMRGFNALFATASIDAARATTTSSSAAGGPAADQRLKIGLIFSYAANERSTTAPRRRGVRHRRSDQSDARSFLEDAIQDYNDMFGTSYDTSADKFQNYYKDLSLAAEEPRARPGHRRQHVPDRLRRHDAEHAVRRQEPAGARPHPGVLAHQPHPELGQDLRQHRVLPRPRGRHQRRHRPLRQQGRRGVVLLKPYAEYYDEYAEKVDELLERVPPG